MSTETGVVTIRNIDVTNGMFGCTSGQDSKLIHFGFAFIRLTACGQPTGDILLSSDITVDCPECVAEINHRAKNRQAAIQAPGVVTHKQQS